MRRCLCQGIADMCTKAIEVLTALAWSLSGPMSLVLPEGVSHVHNNPRDTHLAEVVCQWAYIAHPARRFLIGT